MGAQTGKAGKSMGSENVQVQDRAEVITHPPVIYAAAFLVGLLLHAWLPLRFLPGATIVWIAAPLVSIAVFVVLSAVWALTRAHTTFDARKPTTSIVTGGPYRLTRNPAYLSLTLLYIGVAALFNSLAILGMVVPAVVVTHFGVILREESYLERKFGDEYRRYKARVRRWI
ncbi:MAG: isoprenylcysteine carboxylmethyltransferase family protein [bacterium]